MSMNAVGHQNKGQRNRRTARSESPRRLQSGEQMAGQGASTRSQDSKSPGERLSSSPASSSASVCSQLAASQTQMRSRLAGAPHEQPEEPKLERGRQQQRASISSCSSSDSQASYGSGYASGSGHSTDHELRQALGHSKEAAGEPSTSRHKPSPEIAHRAPSDESRDARPRQQENTKMEPPPEEQRRQEDSSKLLSGSQLEGDLDELERITDQLASRSLSLISRKELPDSPVAIGDNQHHHNPDHNIDEHHDFASATIRSTGSTSSALSTGSGSCLSGGPQPAKQLPPLAEPESRSASTTPTHVPPNQPRAPVVRPLNQKVGQMTGGIHASAGGQATGQQPAREQEPYYHNLFHWEHLASKGVTRPLLINDLDFTDLRDEDDCDLLVGGPTAGARGRSSEQPLSISIPPTGAQRGHERRPSSHLNTDSSTDSGAGDLAERPDGCTTPSQPPPMPPPPISPWFGTMASMSARPHSQLIPSPSPPYDQQRGRSPAGYMAARNSLCLATDSPPREADPTMPASLQSSLRSASSMSSLLFGGGNGRCPLGKRKKKTTKLFWKEVREDRSLLAKLTKKRTIWDEIQPVQLDTQKLEYLFESRAKDLTLSRSRIGLDGTLVRKLKINVLDAKRSNAINIGMTKLPPMRTIKSAILKMDSSIVNREGIEKILTTMMPSEEEKTRIIEAQLANPDTPLGTAEQFLLNLASISALEARLKLWAFQLDYAQIEKEVAEPLMDLKQAIGEIERSETFRLILGTLLAIGNFLNSTQVKGFQIEYLEKVPEVKDTVHKHSLLHHLCLFIEEKHPQLTGDLYSEFGAVNRASKVDYAEVGKSLKKMQQDCKASWDYLKIVAKHDGLANLMNPSSSSALPVNQTVSSANNLAPKSQPQAGKLNNLSKLSMITSIMGPTEGTGNGSDQPAAGKQLKTKVSDFLTDCAERIMVLMVVHRRVMNRFQKLLVYLGCSSSQIKQTQPQQILKIINEFALEYRTKRERVRELMLKRQQAQQTGIRAGNRWQPFGGGGRPRWLGSQQCIDSQSVTPHGSQLSLRPGSTASSYADYQELAGGRRTPRQQSVTPTPAHLPTGRPHSMSVSMYDLQDQVAAGACRQEASQQQELELHQRDEQLRRILGAGKSLDGACHELHQLGHHCPVRRVQRYPPMGKLRAASIDLPESQLANQRQSSYYLRCMGQSFRPNGFIDDEEDEEPNSDDEILQSLVRATSAKGPVSQQQQQPQAKGPSSGGHPTAKSKILSRFSCDRKSLRRDMRGIELSNVG